MSAASEGDRMGGRYTLKERIAAGGMGEVWKAEDDVLGRTVALKLLKAGLTDEEGFTERFRNEARLSATLAHGNVAQVYDFGQDEGASYLVMEYVPGRPLSKLISERAPMSPIDSVEILAQAGAALQAAHKNGLIHRDVKPANILIDPDGTAKLTDFGIARATNSVALTRTGEVMGTAQYLAPEAAIGKPATELSDVYSLGVVAYEMLAGRRPFEADTAVALALAHVNEPPPPLPPFVPPTIRAVVHAALEKDPRRRPGSAAEFGRALRQALRDADRMGMLGPGPARGPMGSAGPRALTHDQRAQQHRSPGSGPGANQGSPTRGSGPAARSGPQPQQPQNRRPGGSGPAGAPGPSGPQSRVGGTSGPMQQPRPSGPQPQVSRNSGPQGTVDANSGPQPQQRSSGPQRLVGSGSGPQTQVGSVSATRSSGAAPAKGNERTAAKAKSSSTSKGASAGGSSHAGATPFWQKFTPMHWGIIGAVLLVVLALAIWGIVSAMSSDESDPGQTNPNQPENVKTSFNGTFDPVSMPQRDAQPRSYE
ncbi:protein kinase domain-containing protein [Dermacoccaceae bacterium W4C1]